MSVAHPRTPLETVIDTLAARGRKPRSNGTSWTAQCPAHEDNNPSLAISQGDQGVILHCHAGCDPHAVTAALGLNMRDLFDTPRSNGSDITAIYDYTDEHGTLLFQVVRKPGKQFRQRRPDGNGGWLWNLGDTRRVLYRLPDVLEAIAAGDTIYVVEGEKDADRLAADGHVATTNPHGAGKWRPDYNTTLTGAQVVIVADRDEPGRTHARHVAQQLAGIAATIQILEPVAGKDISDHLAAGHQVDELVDLDNDQDTDKPQWASLIVDGKTWLTSGTDHPEPLWGNQHTILAAKGQPTTIAGPQGAGKSVFGQRLILGWIGLVDDLLGIAITRGERNGLYLACDRPEQARLSARRMVTDNQLDILEARLRVWKGPPPEDVAKQPLMLLEMAQAADADLIVIDSAKDIALKLSADEIGAAYNSALQHCVAADIEVIVLHHPRKLSGETRDNPVRVLDDLYGAYWVTAGNGSVLYLQPGDFDTYTLTQLKSPIGDKAEIPYEHVTAIGDVRAPTAPDLISVLDKAGYDGVSAIHVTKILCKVDAPNETQTKKVRRALNDLAEDGVVESFGATRNKKWRLLEPVEPIRTSESMSESNSDIGPLIRTNPQVRDSDIIHSDTSPPVLRQGDVRIIPQPTYCRCGQQATDISGLCPGCLANPGTANTTLDF